MRNLKPFCFEPFMHPHTRIIRTPRASATQMLLAPSITKTLRGSVEVLSMSHPFDQVNHLFDQIKEHSAKATTHRNSSRRRSGSIRKIKSYIGHVF